MIKKILKIIVLLINYAMELFLAGLGWILIQGGFFGASSTDKERTIGFIMIVCAVVGAYWGQKIFSKKKLWQLLAILGVNFLVFQYLTYIG